MEEPWKSAAILRQCQACNQWRPFSSFPGKWQHTCGRCMSVHVRGYVLTDKGRRAVSKGRAVA